MEKKTQFAKYNLMDNINNISKWQDVKTKISIVSRLFKAGYINADEVVILLLEDDKKDNFQPYPYYEPINTEQYNHWEHCLCNVKNGGSGICGCVLNNPFNFTNGKDKTIK